MTAPLLTAALLDEFEAMVRRTSWHNEGHDRASLFGSPAELLALIEFYRRHLRNIERAKGQPGMALFEEANLLFAGHTVEQSLIAVTVLAAHICGLCRGSLSEAESFVDIVAGDIKRHVGLNWDNICEAKTQPVFRQGLPRA